MLRAFLACLALTSVALADDSAAAFREAFRAYSHLRQLEEKIAINRDREDLEEGARASQNRDLSEKLARARAEWQVFRRPEYVGLVPWQRQRLDGVGKASPPSPPGKEEIDFLQAAYGDKAKAWSPFEWQCARELFGTSTAETFLKLVFRTEGLPDLPGSETAGGTVVWLENPLARLLPKAEAARRRAETQRRKDSLGKRGFLVEELEISAFPGVDEQAEALHLALVQRLEEGPVTLASDGYASAVLLRALDLNPGLLAQPKIRGWLNLNGALFGSAQEPATRSPASLSKADRPWRDAQRSQLLLREERLAPQTPLGAQFPVLNLITVGDGDLRDRLVPDAKTILTPEGKNFEAVGQALRLLPTRAPASGQRDPGDEASF